MNTRSKHGGRHELGQNFLRHRPTIDTIVRLASNTSGPILEIGAGDGVLTRGLARLGRDLVAIDVDEHRVRRLARRLPHVDVRRRDALAIDFDRPVVVGNVPFHLTTPILRRLLASRGWSTAVLVTQWEVARKRSGVGGGTMMTAQAAPWFTFELRGRVPAQHFSPRPSVDGGILLVARRPTPLVPPRDRRAYEAFVRAVFTGRGRGMAQILRQLRGGSKTHQRELLASAAIERDALPRDLSAEQWVVIWTAVSDRGR